MLQHNHSHSPVPCPYNVYHIDSSKFQGRVKAWFKRPRLDGTNQQLHDLRIFVSKYNRLTSKQYAIINTRFKVFETIIPFITGSHRTAIKTLHHSYTQWLKSVHLSIKQIQIIKAHIYHTNRSKCIPIQDAQQQFMFWISIKVQYVSNTGIQTVSARSTPNIKNIPRNAA
eukprot:1014228_1